jgi:branched-chain amino acid transport system permease protein
VGIDTKRLHPLMFGIGLGLSGVAGCLLSMAYTISPSMGEPYTVTALIVITLGGFGSMGGALAGGLLLGVIEAVGMHFTNPSLKALLSTWCSSACCCWKPERPVCNKRSPQGMTDRRLRPAGPVRPHRLGAVAAALRQRVHAVSMALTCLMYVALSSSWGLFCGSTRYLSLATSAFFGIGAYTSALALEKLPWVQSIALGAGIATVVAVVMGAAVLHLRGTYFAVLTFGMTELIRHAITYFEKQVTGTVGRVLTVVPERDTIYLTVLGLAVAVALSIAVRRTPLWPGADGHRRRRAARADAGREHALVKIAGFAMTAAVAGAVGAAMSVRWTYIDPHTVFNPFIGFQTVLIALIGGAITLWGPLMAAVVFSLLAETLRLQAAAGVHDVAGLLLILSVLYLPGGLASLRAETLKAWWRDTRGWVAKRPARPERRQGARRGPPQKA